MRAGSDNSAEAGRLSVVTDATNPAAPVWAAPVRYAEADQQGVVFNAHYLTYCDEALSAFLRERADRDPGIAGLAERVQLVSSTLNWSGPARWGDLIEVAARCTAVGRSSVTLEFEVRASGRECCRVQTVYVHTDTSGRAAPVPDGVRAALLETSPTR